MMNQTTFFTFTHFIPGCRNLHMAAFQLPPTHQQQQLSQEPVQ